MRRKHWPRHGGLGLGLGVGGGVGYLIRDNFITLDAAPLNSPRTAEPGPGIAVIRDGSNVISITVTTLVRMWYQAVSKENADIIWQVPLSRDTGRVALVKFKPNTNNEFCPLALLGTPTTPTWATDAGQMFYFYNVANQLYSNNLQHKLLGETTAMELGVDYWLGLMLTPNGAYYLIKGGVFTEWHVLHEGNNDQTPANPVYLGHSNKGGTGWLSYPRVYTSVYYGPMTDPSITPVLFWHDTFTSYAVDYPEQQWGEGTAGATITLGDIAEIPDKPADYTEEWVINLPGALGRHELNKQIVNSPGLVKWEFMVRFVDVGTGAPIISSSTQPRWRPGILRRQAPPYSGNAMAFMYQLAFFPDGSWNYLKPDGTWGDLSVALSQVIPNINDGDWHYVALIGDFDPTRCYYVSLIIGDKDGENLQNFDMSMLSLGKFNENAGGNGISCFSDFNNGAALANNQCHMTGMKISVARQASDNLSNWLDMVVSG